MIDLFKPAPGRRYVDHHHDDDDETTVIGDRQYVRVPLMMMEGDRILKDGECVRFPRAVDASGSTFWPGHRPGYCIAADEEVRARAAQAREEHLRWLRNAWQDPAYPQPETAASEPQ